jgi:imidazole glycerol-phosphate synthase subunit HisF
MFRPRIIPVLLLYKNGLVKSTHFKNYRYIGDPINAVRIFNELSADELVFLDIQASNENRGISADLVKNIGEEANMPFSVGGGIKSLEEIHDLLSAGAEKVVLNTVALSRPEFIRQAANNFGSSTITVCIDVKKDILGRNHVFSSSLRRGFETDPVKFAVEMESYGAGEIILQSVDRDGMMQGYDLDLLLSVTRVVTIPVVALGGAGSLLHLKEAYTKSFVTALAAGSLFIYHGPRKGILINYPDQIAIEKYFNK